MAMSFNLERVGWVKGDCWALVCTLLSVIPVETVPWCAQVVGQFSQYNKSAEQQPLEPGLLAPQRTADAAIAQRHDGNGRTSRQEEDRHQELARSYIQQEGESSEGPVHGVRRSRRTDVRVGTSLRCTGQYVGHSQFTVRAEILHFCLVNMFLYTDS